MRAGARVVHVHVHAVHQRAATSRRRLHRARCPAVVPCPCTVDSEIVDRAQKELNIEKQIKKIEDTWGVLALVFNPTPDSDITALYVRAAAGGAWLTSPCMPCMPCLANSLAPSCSPSLPHITHHTPHTTHHTPHTTHHTPHTTHHTPHTTHHTPHTTHHAPQTTHHTPHTTHHTHTRWTMRSWRRWRTTTCSCRT
jgi:hypothetical protein